MKERIVKWDNAKAILIFLVVFGHFLTAFKCVETEYLYKVIYLFHMPAFVFLTGMFSGFNINKIVKRILIPYFVFQTLYVLFSFVLMPDRIYKLSYLYPHWLMWYMFSLLGWTITIPLLKTKNKRHKFVAIIIASLCVVVSGYIPGGISFLSASRMFSFYIFFVLGYYCKKYKDNLFQNMNNKYKFFFVLITVIVLVVFAFYYKSVDMDVVRQVAPYASIQDVLIKILTISAGLVLSILFFMMIPNRKIKILTNIGSHTLYIYLLHGFVVRYIEYLYANLEVQFTFVQTMLYSIILSVIVCLICWAVSSLIRVLSKKVKKHTIIDDK